MKFFKGYARIIAASLLIAISQSGCILGFGFFPLWFIGAGGVVSGGVIGAVGLRQKDNDATKLGIHLLIGGTLLGENNSGHVEALNEVPRDPALAKKLSVSLDEISNYNDHLNEIQGVGQKLINDLKPLIKRFKNNEFRPKNLLTDPELNEIAHRYGFGSMKEFFSTKNSKVLPKAYLESFAKATELSVSQARIFLYHAFGIESE